MSLPISLMVDDGAPINPMYWLHTEARHVHIVPNSFTRDFADVCARWGVRGKFSVLPMPSGLGRIDKGLTYVPQDHLNGFLCAVREKIKPHFDITPELLTHQAAFNLKSGSGHLHLYEDEWVARASVAEITDYLSLALRILKNAGLPANGITSPWGTGYSNEKDYAEAIGRAQWRVHRRAFAWYFLHCLNPTCARWPWVTWEKPKEHLRVVTVPANTSDAFWTTQEDGRKPADEGADRLLSADGKRGEIRELFDRGYPIIILTHWQSLFSEGRASGLRGLEKVFGRVRKVFGDGVKWVKCSELARLAVGLAQHAEPNVPGEWSSQCKTREVIYPELSALA